MNEVENNYQDTDLGNVSLNPKDEYDPTVAYEFLDMVSYQGGSYVCCAPYKTTITGTAPEPGKNTEFWQLLTLPGNLTAEAVAMHDDVVNKAAQVEISRAAVEQAQQEVEASQADVQQLHEDTVQAAQEAENSRDSAAGYAQSAETSRKVVSESEQNINAQMTGLNEKVSESVTQAQEEIATARQQAIDAITTQETKSTAEVKRVGDATLESAGQALRDINTAGQQAVQAVTDQQNTSIQAVKDETNSYIEEKRQEISAKTDEVTQAVNQAGEEQLQNIADSLDSTLTESGKAADSKAVGDAIVSVEESKANKSALATTDRKLDALWKLNQGITYQFEEDSEPAYQKTIPTGAKMASVKQIGGKTIVWNQLINETYGKSVTRGNVTITNNKDGSYTVFTNGAATETVEAGVYFLKPNRSAGKYYLKGSPSNGEEIGYNLCGTYIWKSENGKADYGNGVIIDDNIFLNNSDIVRIKVNEGTIISTPIVFKPQLFNLTKMFGVGNEPSTVEEFEAMFPEEYYPYNKGTLLSMPVNEVGNTGKYSHLFSDYQKKWLAENYEEWHTDENMLFKSISSNTVYIVKKADNTTAATFTDYETITATTHTKMHGNVSFNADNILLYNGEMFITKNSVIKFEAVSAFATLGLPQIKITIPQEILDLPGYGWSAGAVCNYVDWENKEYIQRVAAADLGSLSFTSGEYENHKYFNTTDIAKLISPNTMNTLCKRYSHATANAVIMQENMEIVVDAKGRLFLRDDSMNQDATLLKEDLKDTVLYYELAEPIVTNIAEIIPEGFLGAIEVEAGGSLTFQNSNGDGHKVPLPNTVEYAVKLSEVAE